MKEEFLPKLKAIDEAAAPLNEMGNDATTTLKAVEERLRDSGAGVEVWWIEPKEDTSGDFANIEGAFAATFPEVKTDEHEFTARGFRRDFWSLGYGRVEGKFRITIRRMVAEYDGDEKDPLALSTEEAAALSPGKALPVLDCPRDIRIAALRQLPELLDAIKGALDLQLQNTKVHVPEWGRTATVQGVLNKTLPEGATVPETDESELN